MGQAPRFEHEYLHGTPVTRCSDGRQFYLLEQGGRPEAPAHVSLVDRDAEDLCEECGEKLNTGPPAVTVDGLQFHPKCAPRADS